MNASIPISLFGFFIAATFAPTADAAPPVKVEVVVDGDEDDFFEDGSEKKKKVEVKTSVRDRAEAAFDALEAEENKRQANSDNKNKNTQVVNVVVVGGEQQGAKATAQPAPPSPPAAPAAPAAPNAPAPPPPPPIPSASTDAESDWSCWGWFGKESEPKQADLLLFGSLGGYEAGLFVGLGAEAYATDTIGIRLTGHLGAFGSDSLGYRDSGGNFDLFSGGQWSNQRSVTRKNVSQGVAHLVDLSLTVHLFDRSSFDPYVAAGVSHYGYEIEFTDGVDRGGSGYTRLGAGFNWHVGSFFAGLDVGWYPYEFVRYEIERTDGDGDGGRRGDREYEANAVDVEDPFNPERFTATAHLGWRF